MSEGVPAGLSPEQKEQLVVVSGRTHPELGAAIADGMGVTLSAIELADHRDTSIYTRLCESVRDKHVIAIQTHGAAEGKSIADSFVEHVQMLDAARLSGASRITALAPNLAGTRQERQVKPRESVSAILDLRILRLAGATNLVTVDPHSPVTHLEGITSTTLTAQTLLREAVTEEMTDLTEGYVVVSPDVGHSKDAQVHADALGLGLVTMRKVRDPDDPTKINRPDPVDGVEGLTCLIFDDMIDTAGTLASAAETLERSGAKAVYAAATHGFFSDPGLERLQSAPINKIFITDTLPVGEAQEALGDRLEVVTVGDMIADSMVRIIQGRSVSETAAGQSYR